jgi:hypothetical protein
MKNGIGKLMSPEGNYYYGRFVDNKKDGVGFSYKREDGEEMLYLWVKGDRKEMI